MPIKDDGIVEYVEINGEQVPKIVVPAEITITNTETGQEYGSAKEADDDVANPRVLQMTRWLYCSFPAPGPYNVLVFCSF